MRRKTMNKSEQKIEEYKEKIVEFKNLIKSCKEEIEYYEAEAEILKEKIRTEIYEAASTAEERNE